MSVSVHPVFHRNFTRQYKKLPRKIQNRFDDRLSLLLEDMQNPLLGVHMLHGEKKPLLSMNVSGDYRALFLTQGNTVTFYEIGTHSELYS